MPRAGISRSATRAATSAAHFDIALALAVDGLGAFATRLAGDLREDRRARADLRRREWLRRPQRQDAFWARWRSARRRRRHRRAPSSGSLPERKRYRQVSGFLRAGAPEGRHRSPA